MPTPPIFIDTNVEEIQNRLVERYELATGTTLQPSRVERLILNEVAYEISLLCISVQNAAVQNLLAFASAPVLDFHADRYGLSRLPAAPSRCTLRFSLEPTHLGVTIPAGTRVRTQDGQATFATIEDANVAAGVTPVFVEAEATTPGAAANGYANNTVTVILDPQAFILSVRNTTPSSGGADQEADDQLRERIRLAPSSFSVAGPTDAYEFFARGANPAIIDAKATRPTPGTVLILPLMFDGSVTPQTVIDDVLAACNDIKTRPLNDTVIVQSPERIEYDLDVSLTLYDDADLDEVVAAVTAALEEFTTSARQRMGFDVKATQVTQVVQAVAGVYTLDLGAFESIIVSPLQFAFCTAIQVTVTGFNEG
jgi:phage-related baseplate assembly protein